MNNETQMFINGYTVGQLENANSGNSKWGFATKNGKEYFIKELLNPVYPMDSSIMPVEMFNSRRAFCTKYETDTRDFFNLINRASHGNLVRINEFFRCDSRYYIVTEKINGRNVPVEHIATLPEHKKRLLLKTVAHCFYDLHSVGIVHFDVKPANILMSASKTGNYVARLIDFDSGFLKGKEPDNDELGGDLTYLAPETFLAIIGEGGKPDEKADIFALGLIFHEYWCGFLPEFNASEYEYPYEAALDGVLKIESGMIPTEIAELIGDMLNSDPAKRPSAGDIIARLNGMASYEPPKEEKIEYKAVAEDRGEVSDVAARSGDWFHSAGDL